MRLTNHMLTSYACICASAAAHMSSSWPDNFLFIESQGTGPEQIWINFGATPDAMVFNWLSNGTADSVVQACAGNNPVGPFTINATGTSNTYTSGGYTSGSIHRATLTGLAANTVYSYRVGGDASGWSAPVTFTSHPGVGALYPTRFGVIGDLGQTNNSNATIWHVKSIQPPVSSAFITGDLSYADGDQPRWDSFGRLMQPLASSLPVMVAPGNHEIEGLPLFQAYNYRFGGMPFPAGSADGPQYYSYNVGPAHVLIVNSFGIYSAGSPQYKFVQKDLASIDRSVTPWLLVILHAPWYNSNKDHTSDGQLMRITLEPLFHAAGMAACFAGHVHAYERSVPVYNNILDPTGATYFTIGDGGNREGLYKNWIDPQPNWSTYRDAEYGHGVFTILNASSALWEWHKDVDTEPVISDSAYIPNPYSAA